MIRPEVIALFKRYGEMLIGLLIAGFGVRVATSIGLFWQAMGVVILCIGLGIAWSGWRRARLAATHTDGPGVVEVDERQVTYFAPYEGGAVSINDLARVTIVTNDQGPQSDDIHWLLEENGGARLLIPNSAEGAGQLFDALAPLKGIDFEVAIRAMGSTTNASFVIWAKDRARLH